jgi:hypothetical protein
VALEHMNRPAYEIVDAILRASEDFSQGRAAHDDRTVVVLRVADPAAGATRTERRMVAEPEPRKRTAAVAGRSSLVNGHNGTRRHLLFTARLPRPVRSPPERVVRGSLEMIS